MWWKEYKDYPHDSTLRRQQLSAGHGIIGCEMHDHHGWGETSHRPSQRPTGKLASWLSMLVGGKVEEQEEEMVREKGTHTFERYLRYHCCPSCGLVTESREDYEYRLGEYVKELQCRRCGKGWSEKKAEKPSFGPLLRSK